MPACSRRSRPGAARLPIVPRPVNNGTVVRRRRGAGGDTHRHAACTRIGDLSADRSPGKANGRTRGHVNLSAKSVPGALHLPGLHWLTRATLATGYFRPQARLTRPYLHRHPGERRDDGLKRGWAIRWCRQFRSSNKAQHVNCQLKASRVRCAYPGYAGYGLLPSPGPSHTPIPSPSSRRTPGPSGCLSIQRTRGAGASCSHPPGFAFARMMSRKKKRQPLGPGVRRDDGLKRERAIRWRRQFRSPNKAQRLSKRSWLRVALGSAPKSPGCSCALPGPPDPTGSSSPRRRGSSDFSRQQKQRPRVPAFAAMPNFSRCA